MKSKGKKEPVIASNTFTCPTCANMEFDGTKEFVDHIKTVHYITETQGRRQMTMHLDCADSYISNYEWTLGGMTFFQSTVNPRSKDDMMRYA